VCTICFNRPKRKNAFNADLYDGVIKALEWADRNDDVVLAVITGAGDYYSSGNDLGNFAKMGGDIAEGSRQAGLLLKRFVEAFIAFSKPLIAAVNGPAIGIAVTTLALCDVVYAADTATFQTPFAALGQAPEGVSSLLFPQLMGTSKANEVLLFGKKLTAKEAESRNLVAEVLPAVGFHAEIHKRALQYAKLPPKVLQSIKKIVRDNSSAQMSAVNTREVELLTKLWVSEDCLNAIMAFMQTAQSKRSKL